MKIIPIILISFLSAHSTFGQDLKKRKIRSEDYQEEFTVFKKDKNIKHGQYLKFRLDILGNKSISEIGQFEQGNKTGNWYQFTSNGHLRSEGQYSNGFQSGLWNFYYEPINENPTIASLLDTNNGIIINENGSIEIDKEGLIVSSKGIFHLGKKTGAWDYYSREGSLMHKFNHESNELLINNASDSLNYCWPFLGGGNRFFSLFNWLQRENKSTLPSKNSKVIIKLKTNSLPISVEISETYGDEEFAQNLVELIMKVEANYLTGFIDNTEGEILFIAEFKTENNSNVFTTRFEQKDAGK